MLNTQGGGSKYTKYTVFLACEQIHSKYTAKYTVSGGGAGYWQTRESHAQMVKSKSEIPKSSITCLQVTDSQGQMLVKAAKNQRKLTKYGKFSFACGALVGSSGPHRVCILALWEQIHKIHCVFSPSPNTQNTDLTSS